MKYAFSHILLVGFLATATCVPLQSDDVKEFEEFKEFQLRYGKEYETLIEESFRMKIFMENKLKIDSHNKLYNSGLKSFTQKVNEFSDMLPSEFSSTRKGRKVLMSKKRLSNFRAASFLEPDDDVVLPESVDWFTMGAVTPVKNQGNCGSCYTFSATGALEGQNFLRHGKLVSLSEQNLVDCSSSYGNDGCAGGLVESCFDYIKINHGIDTEESYPYQAKDHLSCRYNPTNSGSEDVGFVQIQNGSEDALKKAVAIIGPISVAIDASSDSFQNYYDGVYVNDLCYKDNEHLDHAVLVTGYGTTEGGDDYWLVKNSWGRRWGMDGYIKMARNKDNMCGIATDALFPLL